ncbi:hypothetical protein RUM43_006078 [Polyplax serrata]|uniref:Uncharacterized protein n=1 Tax=Polyplax serrata TaxID=468196 RepID=A0AAN8S8X9_POLSC
MARTSLIENALVVVRHAVQMPELMAFFSVLSVLNVALADVPAVSVAVISRANRLGLRRVIVYPTVIILKGLRGIWFGNSQQISLFAYLEKKNKGKQIRRCKTESEEVGEKDFPGGDGGIDIDTWKKRYLG